MSTLAKVISEPEEEPEVPDTDTAFVNWPMVVASYSIGGSQTEQLGSEPYRSVFKQKDLLIPQCLDIRSSGVRSVEAGLLAWFRSNASHLKLARYIVAESCAKTTANGDPQGILYDVCQAAIASAPRWFQRNSANQIVENEFSPEDWYQTNTAIHLSGVNAGGQDMGQAFAQKLDELTALNSLQDYLDTFYFDVTCPMPRPVFLNNGTTGTNYDFTGDGVADNTASNTVGASDATDGGARMHRRGYKMIIQRFRERFPGMPMGCNSGRHDLDYSDGGSQDPPVPLTANEFGGVWDYGIREFSDTIVGVKENPSVPNSLVYAYDGWNNFWNDMEVCKWALTRDEDSPWGYSFVVVDVQLGYRKNGAALTQDELEFLRFHAALALMTRNLAIGITHLKNEPAWLDECVLIPGNPRGAWNMGVQDPNTYASQRFAWTTRAADLTNGSGRVWIQEFDDMAVAIRGDHAGISANQAYPGGTALSFTLPSAGTGYKWQMPNAATYTNPHKGPMRNQSPLINNGADVTSLLMRPKTARFFRRVPV